MSELTNLYHLATGINQVDIDAVVAKIGECEDAQMRSSYIGRLLHSLPGGACATKTVEFKEALYDAIKEYVPADVDGDGAITKADADAVKSYIGYEVSGETSKYDVDGDNDIDVKDYGLVSALSTAVVEETTEEDPDTDDSDDSDDETGEEGEDDDEGDADDEQPEQPTEPEPTDPEEPEEPTEPKEPEVDLATVIVNPTFEDFSGWDVDGFVLQTNDETPFEVPMAEMWSAETTSGKVSQTLTTQLPAGNYKLTANAVGAFGDTEADGTYLFVEVNGNKYSTKVAGIEQDPVQKDVTVDFTVNNKTDVVTVGFERINSKWWSAVDDVKIIKA